MTEANLDSWENIARQYAQNADYWRERAERAEAERDEIIESYRELRDKCNDAYLQRDGWQVRANTAERKAGEWRDASFAVDAQLRHAQTERDTLNVDAKAWLDNCRKERERAERAEAAGCVCHTIRAAIEGTE